MRNFGFCPTRHWRAVCVLALAFAAGGCATLTRPGQDSAPAPQQACDCPRGSPAGGTAGEQRQLLNEGYSLLYTDAKKLDLTNLLLYVKSASDDFEAVIKEVAAYAGKVKLDLERIEKNYPAVRTDLDPLPVMEKRKRWAIGKDRAIEFAPVVGRSGRDYERTVLISLMNGINHQSHLCKVLADEEPETSLKKSLADIEQGYAVLYDRIDALLTKAYFKD